MGRSEYSARKSRNLRRKTLSETTTAIVPHEGVAALPPCHYILLDMTLNSLGKD